MDITIATIKTLAADLATIKNLSDHELGQVCSFVHEVCSSKRSELYYAKTEPLRLAAQAAGFPNGWAEKPEWIAAQAAGVAAQAADADFQLVLELNKALIKESRRRRANRAKIANAEKRAAAAVPAGTYSVGEVVEVHAFGRWYRGAVTKIGRTGKVTVEYTSGTGATHLKSVNSSKIRKV